MTAPRLRSLLPAPVLAAVAAITLLLPSAPSAFAQQAVLGTRDPAQQMDEDFAKAYAEWTSEPRYGSPLVDHLPKVDGIPTPKDVLGHYIGAPKTLTYYEDILRYYRALAAATPRVMVESIGRSDEGRELVVVWVSSDENMANLQQNRANLARLADPRGLSDDDARELIAATKPQYHLMGGLHSGETGPPEMLMELVYRLAVETSPVISQIRDNVYVSVTPAAEPDGRDRNVDWFYQNMALEEERAEKEKEEEKADSAAAGEEADSTAAEDEDDNGGGRRRGAGVPYWGKYVYHDNNRDINLSQMSMRAIVDWYYTAHPPIVHDLHESQTLLYTYSGGPPQNPNLDPILFGELRWFSNWELSQMTKWGMPGVYTHAFMDGWSPGYLGSVAYNHNGMMRMYETQSGRDVDPDSVRAAREEEEAGGTAGGGRGRGRGGAAGAGGGAAGARGARGGGAAAGARGGGRGRGGAPTGRGGSQDREWYRGLPVPDDAVATFTRRNNTNYMETGVISGLQLTAMFPGLVLENFWIKSKHSVEDGRTEAPYAYVLPVERDMTRVVALVDILRAQGIEIGRLDTDVELEADTLRAGSYLVKLDQPYGRLAKNFLERQDYPDPNLRTYDDSGWTMGYAFNADVQEIDDKDVLEARVTPVDSAVWQGSVTGDGTAGLAVAHYGSNNMITFRYGLREVPMQIAEESFTADGITFPPGSFIVSGSPETMARARTLVDSLGLTAAALSELPSVRSHDGDAPRVAIYSQWSGTQDLGWYRHAFDQFGIPFDLIYKERVARGNLRADYDVILMAAQNISKESVLAEPADDPVPYEKTDEYRFLGMYGESPDITGGFGEEGIEAFQRFLESGGTLIAAAQSVSFPIEMGFARTVETETPQGVNAQKPLVQARIVRTDHPVFYGWQDSIFPMKYRQGAQVFRVGVADEDRVLARYVGGDSSVLSGLMEGADNIADRAFVIDAPRAYMGGGRVLMFANNPIYRWQNHGEFNMVFNSVLNWNDVPGKAPSEVTEDGERSSGGSGRRPLPRP